MEFLEGKALSRHLLERYVRDPRGWSFVVAPARSHGFFDGIFSSPDEAWHIKLDSIFKPNPLTLGVRTEAGIERFRTPDPTPFGYRKLDPRLAMEMLKMIEADGTEMSGGEPNLGALIRSIEPTVPIPGESYAEGPFVYTNAKIIEFTDKEKTLDDRLASELLRLLRNRYPSYG
jgi:hypothetical protein